MALQPNSTHEGNSALLTEHQKLEPHSSGTVEGSNVQIDVDETESPSPPQLFDEPDSNPTDQSLRQQLSGYNPNQDTLVSSEFRLKQDQEATTERTISEKPSVRLGIVLLVVGGAFGTLGVLWAAFFAPKEPMPPATQTPKPIATASPPVSEDVQGLKSKLAFQDQKRLVTQATAKPTPAASHTTATAKSTPVPSEKPTPRSSSVASLPPITPTTTPIRSIPLPVAASTPVLDPAVQWHKLAALGQEQSTPANDVSTSEVADLPLNQLPINNRQIPVQPNPDVTVTQPSNLLTPVKIGASTPPNDEELSPGEIGILNQARLATVTPASHTDAMPKTVAMGSTAEASIAIPLVWAGVSQPTTDKSVANRFAIALTTPLPTIDGTPALPTETMIIAEATTVNNRNHLVTARPIAIVYKNDSGQIHQQALSPDSMTIMGENAQPLIGKSATDNGSVIAQQDLLIGLLSGVERAAEIMNQPTIQTDTNINSGLLNQQVTTRNSRPNVLAAALEGFFKPTLDRISTRSKTAEQELLSRPNITVLPKNQKVSIVIQRPLEIQSSI